MFTLLRKWLTNGGEVLTIAMPQAVTRLASINKYRNSDRLGKEAEVESEDGVFDGT